MKTRHLIDPELLPMVDNFPAVRWEEGTLAEVRALMEQIGAAIPTPDVPVDVRESRIPGPEGAPEVPVVIYRPADVAGKLPALLHIHGGGYVAGLPQMADAQNRQLAHDLQCVIVSVDYRLAPETPHPGPLEDCYAGLRWLYANAASLGVDATRIAIGGESAGGGLTAALALLARDRGEVPLVLQILIYPMLDDRTATNIAPSTYSGEFLWDSNSNVFGWRSYLGREPGGDTHYYAAPARAENLAGLPPAFVAVGQLDLFIDEDIEYARRLIDAGVPTELHVYPGAFHGFDMADCQSARTHAASLRTALRRTFGN